MADGDLGDLWLDHIGLVVDDVAPVVAQLREAGFTVSDPVALQGESGPLGQDSAHCVFANFYIEISAPLRGSGNHLEPLLAEGPGVKIIAVGCSDAAAVHQDLMRNGIACGPLRDASRDVALAAGTRTARFRWFAVEDGPPGAITAMVEHRDADIVFASELTQHRNGARHATEVVLGSAGAALAPLAYGKPRAAPALRLAEDDGAVIGGIALDGAIVTALEICGLTLQSCYQIEVPHP